jgi:hypothetical protein
MQCWLQRPARPALGCFTGRSVNEEIGGQAGHLVDWLLDRCQWWAHELGHGNSVKADNRKIMRDVESKLVGYLKGGDRKNIAPRQDGARRLAGWRCEQFAGRISPEVE